MTEPIETADISALAKFSGHPILGVDGNGRWAVHIVPPLGPNAARPEHGAANLADARAYHERLAARAERDES